jgi:hypothetical protein
LPGIVIDQATHLRLVDSKSHIWMFMIHNYIILYIYTDWKICVLKICVLKIQPLIMGPWSTVLSGRPRPRPGIILSQQVGLLFCEHPRFWARFVGFVSWEGNYQWITYVYVYYIYILYIYIIYIHAWLSIII